MRKRYSLNIERLIKKVLMRVGIISERALTKKHGTGAQLLRLFANADVEFFHLYFLPGHGDVSSCENSYNLIDNRPGWTRRLGLGKVHETLFPGWWRGGHNVRRRKFLKLKRHHDLQCDVAYVIVGSEAAARSCISLLSYLNCPYVVHIMDIYHDALEPSLMPGFQTLLTKAKTAIGITPAVCAQIAKFDVADVRGIFIGQESDVPQAHPPVPHQKVQVIMAGRPYKGGIELLETALPAVTAKYPQVSFAYAGDHFDNHPQRCKQAVHNYGYIGDAAAYSKVIAESKLAYLTGPSELDIYGLYSFPSRTSDYLMAGLPLIACVAPDTATEQILRPLTPDTVRYTHTPEQMINAFDYYLGSEAAWCLASHKGRAFALNTMSIDVVRQQIFDALEQASKV